jgi:C-terminal processing protease CtpA/Prc
MMRSIASLVLTSSLLLSATACAQPSETAGTITADALADDLREWEAWLMATHPDPSFSMDVEQVAAQFDAIEGGLDGTYTRRMAWAEFAVLNPHFGDGHVAIRLPRNDYDAYLDNGGAAFPIPVTFADGRLRVAAAISDASPLSAGDEILAINGEPAEDIAAAIFARTHGDSEGLRHYLLETRFSQYLWAITGGAEQWSLQTRDQAGRHSTLQVDPTRDVGDAAPDNWSLAFIDDVALLTVNTFDPALEEPFSTFLETAFADISAAGSDALIIDISRNGGGAHMLSDRLFAYITTQRHTPLSAVTARITPENQARIPGAEIGQVVSVPFAQWIEPPEVLANRFDGDVVLLVGAGTYSQAIVMAATAQDFGIAPVAGPGTEGRANSTGQVQTRILTHSRLEVGAPIYIFTRASGDTSANPIVPDIPLSGTREEQITALIARLSGD